MCGKQNLLRPFLSGKVELLLSPRFNAVLPAFEDDLMRQSAVVRQLEIIGEATKRLSEEFRRVIPKSPGEKWPECVTFSSTLMTTSI